MAIDDFPVWRYRMRRCFPAAGGMLLLLALTAAAATEVTNQVPGLVSEFGAAAIRSNQVPGLVSEFGAAAIRHAAGGLSLGHVVISVSGDLKSEAFRIRATNGGYAVTGGDARGSMYGALDFAEQLELT